MDMTQAELARLAKWICTKDDEIILYGKYARPSVFDLESVYFEDRAKPLGNHGSWFMPADLGDPAGVIVYLDSRYDPVAMFEPHGRDIVFDFEYFWDDVVRDAVWKGIFHRVLEMIVTGRRSEIPHDWGIYVFMRVGD